MLRDSIFTRVKLAMNKIKLLLRRKLLTIREMIFGNCPVEVVMANPPPPQLVFNWSSISLRKITVHGCLQD